MWRGLSAQYPLRMNWRLPLVLLAALALTLAPGSANALELSLPVDCTPGHDCFLQNLVDVDPTDGAADYACRHLTYDGHKGTDIRLPDRRALEPGVAVLAAAPGRVEAVRDGEADRDFDAPLPDVTGKECGNGVLIEHEDGWSTQYCHMKSGTIAVRPGETVARGARLGAVGASGDTEFTHLHLTLRHGSDVVDPFTGAVMGTLPCGQPGQSLWTPAAAAQLTSEPVAVINAGFAPGPVEMAAIEQGEVAPVFRDSPALVFYGRAIATRLGDRARIIIDGPGLSLKQTWKPFEKSQAQIMRFAGKRRPPDGWRPGRYTGVFQILRGDEPIAQESRSLTLE